MRHWKQGRGEAYEAVRVNVPSNIELLTACLSLPEPSYANVLHPSIHPSVSSNSCQPVLHKKQMLFGPSHYKPPFQPLHFKIQMDFAALQKVVSIQTYRRSQSWRVKIRMYSLAWDKLALRPVA